MNLDVTILRLMKHRTKYDAGYSSIPQQALQPHTKVLLTDFGAYFREFSLPIIETDPFMLWFSGFRHPTLKPETVLLYRALIEEAQQDVSKGLEDGMMARLVSASTAVTLADVLARWHEGQDVNLLDELRANTEQLEQQLKAKVQCAQVLDPVEKLLEAEDNDTGLSWRLPCLNRHIKPLQPGDFIIVAARPDRGKTTFCASELTHMAAQVDGLYPGEGRSILWLNNEGPGNRIVLRAFQAALNATTQELAEFSKAGTIREKYAQALGGRGGTLRIFDVHGMSSHEIEGLFRKHRPAAVLFDMIDNVAFSGLNPNARTDQTLEGMYQWARLMGVKYGCPILATSQLSADADGLQFPTLTMLKDSKTGKQGAADVIITIGASNDPMLRNSRYMGTTKNKKVRTGAASSPNQEVTFDGDRARYTEQ
jgi:replicative DNA helicase